MELPPAISGSAVQGQTLDCSTGTWLNNPTGYSYSWERDAVTPIGSGNSYTVTASDVGRPEKNLEAVERLMPTLSARLSMLSNSPLTWQSTRPCRQRTRSNW